MKHHTKLGVRVSVLVGGKTPTRGKGAEGVGKMSSELSRRRNPENAVHWDS
ncbi:MAG: hypothetical protein JJU28_06090 [Cyclobacteriaceae bacterium]|nr:hypothetical protein [Cyclobacteriaceae bacterium]